MRKKKRKKTEAVTIKIKKGRIQKKGTKMILKKKNEEEKDGKRGVKKKKERKMKKEKREGTIDLRMKKNAKNIMKMSMIEKEKRIKMMITRKREKMTIMKTLKKLKEEEKDVKKKKLTKSLTKKKDTKGKKIKTKIKKIKVRNAIRRKVGAKESIETRVKPEIEARPEKENLQSTELEARRMMTKVLLPLPPTTQKPTKMKKNSIIKAFPGLKRPRKFYHTCPR